MKCALIDDLGVKDVLRSLNIYFMCVGCEVNYVCLSKIPCLLYIRTHWLKFGLLNYNLKLILQSCHFCSFRRP